MAEAGAGQPMRWWGWGDGTRHRPLPEHALALLAQTVGLGRRPRPPVALEHVRIGPPRIPETTIAALRAIVGSDGVRADHRERVAHAAGKGYPDLVRMRDGEPEGAPDAVVLPRELAHVRAVLSLCERASLAVVPFGGGTSVVGGVAPLSGDHGGVIALDLGRMDALLALDGQSRIATVQAGIRAPELERRLEARGLTLGHFPQSFEYVSLGGCAATRSAGQASSGYGSIERMILGLTLAAPTGEVRLPPVPATAAGPGLRQLLVGSEGTLGVICELALRVRPAPRERHYEGVSFESFQAGAQALRALTQEHAVPDVARLSDEPETRISLALAGPGGVRGGLGRLYLAMRGLREHGVLAILGFEGAPEEVAARRARALELVRRHGGAGLGPAPGRAWLRGRYDGPYVRDELLTNGVMAETLETATSWSNLMRLHERVGTAISRALTASGTPGIVMCHVSHLYETGASLYFTFLAPRRAEDEIGQWRAVKEAASAAIMAGGGTITHHHAVGRDHEPWMREEVGDVGLAALRAVKAELDPAGIMNPGKLVALSRSV